MSDPVAEKEGEYSLSFREEHPPSTYAISSLVRGEPGAGLRVAYLTAARAVAIAPGLYLAGIKGRQLAAASALSSVAITTAIAIYKLVDWEPGR
jgi:hypothetical protein